MPEAERISYIALADLRPHPDNPKAHDVEAVAASIRRFGFITPLVVNAADGLLLEGHGRVEALEAMRDAGEAPPAGVRRGWRVPVVVGVSLAPDAARAFLVASNRTVELGGWDEGRLAALLSDLAASGGTEGTGYSDADLEELLASVAGAGTAVGLTDPDDAPEERAETAVQRGEVYRLGQHRLMCGDSTDAADVARLLDGAKPKLMATDPPYAIYGSSTGIGSDIADDKMVRPFFEGILRLAADHLVMFGHVYVCCDWRSWPSWWEMAKRVELSPKNLLVWDKGGGGLGSSYANTYELIGFFAKLPRQKVMTSNERSGQRQVHKPNIWRGNRIPGAQREHNAQKPVELMEFLIENSSDAGDIVLEPFAGSGTTIVAAERQSRRCYAMEIEPKYVQVCIDRWEAYTGGRAERIDG